MILSLCDVISHKQTPQRRSQGLEARVNQEALHYINVTDVLRETSELLLHDDLGSPLVQQREGWLSDPMTAVDPGHLAVTPTTCERVGRHVLGLAAAVLERQLQATQGRLGDARF